MQRRQVILLVLLIVLAAGVLYLAKRTRQPPLLPEDEDHRAFVSAEACISCHGPEGLPQAPNHPPGQDCLRCHGWP